MMIRIQAPKARSESALQSRSRSSVQSFIQGIRAIAHSSPFFTLGLILCQRFLFLLPRRLAQARLAEFLRLRTVWPMRLKQRRIGLRPLKRDPLFERCHKPEDI